MRPGTDFRAYTKVMLGPTQVAFAEQMALGHELSPDCRLARDDRRRRRSRLAQDTRTGAPRRFRRAVPARRVRGRRSAAAAGVLGSPSARSTCRQRRRHHCTQALPSRGYARGRVRDAGARGPRFHYRDVARAYRRPHVTVWSSGRSPPRMSGSRRSLRTASISATTFCSLGAEFDRRVEVGVADWR